MQRLERFFKDGGVKLPVSNWLAETGHEDVTTELYTGFRHELHNYAEIKDDVADGIIEFMDEVLTEGLID